MHDPHGGHGAHGHDEHDEHHGLPPPEPENIAIGSVLVWGGASFLFVIASILLVGSYFWVERLAEDKEKVGQYGANQERVKLLHAEEAQRLSGYRKLEDGKFQVPIERAMELVVADYQRQAAIPPKPAPAPAPATEAAPATDAAPPSEAAPASEK